MNWIKYLVIMIVFIGFFVFVSFIGLRHETNVISTQEVRTGMNSTNVGEARVNLDTQMDRQMAISNMLLKVADAHKYHEHDTEISYVFIDKEGNVTTNEDNINSIQFEVKLLNRDGNVLSVSTERLEIDSLLGG